MLNPQIRGILGVLLILIPIGAVGFGVLGIQATYYHGYVYDIDSNLPIQGAYVQIIEATIGYGGGDATNENGLYSLDCAANGDVTFRVMKAGYETVETTIYNVPAGGTIRKDFYMSTTSVPEQAWVHGFVYDASDNSIIGSARVYADDGTDTLSGQYLGEYSLVLTTIPKDYTITASKAGYTPKSHNFYLEDGDDITYDFYLSPETSDYGTLTGTVRKDVGASPYPVMRATIHIDETGDIIENGNDGRYSIELPSGGYTVTAMRDGYNSQTKSTTINAGGTSTVDFYLEEQVENTIGALRGHIKNSTNYPIFNADITLTSSSNDNTYLTTDSNGFYETSLEAGAYTISITASAYEDYSTTVQIIAEQTTTLDVIMDETPPETDPNDNETPDESTEDKVDFNMLLLTALMIGIGVILLLSCMTMNFIVLFIGFIVSAGVWVLYNYQSIGGIF